MLYGNSHNSTLSHSTPHINFTQHSSCPICIMYVQFIHHQVTALFHLTHALAALPPDAEPMYTHTLANRQIDQPRNGPIAVPHSMPHTRTHTTHEHTSTHTNARSDTLLRSHARVHIQVRSLPGLPVLLTASYELVVA